MIFSIFLYKIAKHLTDACFREICIFICFYRRTLNEKGWSIKRDLLKCEEITTNQTEETNFCKINNAECALEIANEFISDYFPRYWKELNGKLNDFKVLGDEEEKMKNLVYLTQHFCNWLFNNYYTNSKLSLNLA